MACRIVSPPTVCHHRPAISRERVTISSDASPPKGGRTWISTKGKDGIAVIAAHTPLSEMRKGLLTHGDLMGKNTNDGTLIVPISTEVESSPALRKRLDVRKASPEMWIEAHASGTLRKNKRLGFAWRDQYLKERVCFEFGWAFLCVPRTRVTWGTPITEGDNHSITEAGWHIDRMLTLWPFPEDYFEAKFLEIELADGKSEGVGLVLRETSAAWIPAGFLVCGIIAEYDPRQEKWLEAIPC